VDDEPEAVELVEFNLKQSGFDVLTASDGAEAVKKAHSALPSLIVLDLMLPEIDGLEVCKMLRRDPATAAVPIVMVTAKAAEDDKWRIFMGIVALLLGLLLALVFQWVFEEYDEPTDDDDLGLR
jgi:DNA-binding response OmpR family regulator